MGEGCGAGATLAAMSRRSWCGLAAFVAWTFFIWLNRLANAWGSDTESTSGKVVSTVLALAFLAFGAYGIAVLVRTWKGRLQPAAARVLQAYVALTVVVWAVRIPLIFLADHEIGFKVVHAVLGVIAIALGVGVWRTASAVAGRPGDGRALAGTGRDAGRR
jgi:hypothetical protein